MHEAAHGKPDDNGDDFDEHMLFEALREQMIDPFVTRIHEQARELEQYANKHNIPQIGRDMMIRKLDHAWRPYMARPIIVSGGLWSMRPGEDVAKLEQVAGLEVISNGFSFFGDKIELDGELMDGHSRIGHSVLIDAGIGNGLKMAGFMALDDLAEIKLPYASPDMRRTRFPYDHPEVAAEIDEILFKSKRDDSALVDMAEFATEANISTREGQEYLLDTTEYLNSKLGVDPELPYRMVLLGDLYALGGEDLPVSLRSDTPKISLVTVEKALVRPTDPNATTERDVILPCSVFYEGQIHSADKTTPAQHVAIPATSILSVNSVRYDIEQ